MQAWTERALSLAGRRGAVLLAALSLAAATLPSTAAPPPGESSGYVNFSFDQVDVATFVKLVGELTGRRFVIADGVQGRITVVSPQVSRAEIHPLFLSILQSVNCSVMQDGEVWRVVPLAERAVPMAPVVGPGETSPGGVITKVFRLEYVAASELRKLLEPKITGGKNGAVAALDDTNHLIVTDTSESIRQVERLVQELDRPGLARSTEVVPLQFAGAEEMASQLNAAIQEREGKGERLVQSLPQAAGRSGGSANGRAVVVAAPHANSLILVGSAVELTSLKALIREMDVDTPRGRGRLNAIFVKYISAEEAAKSISALLERAPVGGDAKAGATAGGVNRSGIAIQADAANNALLVDASPNDFDVVRKLVDQLDQVPRQVHITVMIAELAGSDELKLGFDMAAIDMPKGAGDTVVVGSSTLQDDASTIMNAVQQGILPGGLTIGIAHGTRVNSSGEVVTGYPGLLNIQAMKSKGHFEVLSETSLEAQNNREANVNIVNEIPILKSTIQGGSGTSRDVIQNIERMDVGIKLKLTPHIIPGGEVQMELNPSIEAVIQQVSDTALTPTIAKRSVQTTVTVPDGETIVIAGLTRRDQSRSQRRVPLLGDIPLIGRLFRSDATSDEKTNLLIFVTPRIVPDVTVARQVKEEWQGKTGLPPDDQK